MSEYTSMVANSLRESAKAIVRIVNSTQPDKIEWSPLGEGRTVLDMVQECAVISLMSQETFSKCTQPEFDFELFGKLKVEYNTIEKAIEAINTNTEALAKIIEAFPDDKLSVTIHLPFGSGLTKTFAEFMMMPVNNMIYHYGQINYIQTLYGDKEMH